MKLASAAQMRELDRQAIEERGIASIKLMECAAAHVTSAVLLLAEEKTGISLSIEKTDVFDETSAFGDSDVSGNDGVSPNVNGGSPYRDASGNDDSSPNVNDNSPNVNDNSPKVHIAVLCGSGNNGGDGFAAARMLSLAGAQVRTYLAGNPQKLTPDAQEELRRLTAHHFPFAIFNPADDSQIHFIRHCDVVVDALFGVGLSRDIPPGSLYAAAIKQINLSHGAVLSVDIPSGICADTGHIAGCAVQADETVTFSFMKPGHTIASGALYAGNVRVCDIGIPDDLQKALVSPYQTVEASFVRHALPPRKPDAHKGNFGKVLIIGGSAGYTGAPFLTASAAVHSGCGLVYMGVPAGIWAVEAVKCTSAMPFPIGKPDSMQLDRKALSVIPGKMKNCDALALGPGLGRSKDLSRLVCDVLKAVEKPVVLDADGINALEGHIDILDARRNRITILTPHDGEFARLTGTLPADAERLQTARNFAREHGCILVLKGHRTLTATPSGTVLVNTTGNSGLAKGGSGDILTGLIVSLLAQGASAVQAAAGAVWIHGRAGDRAADIKSAYAVTPSDVISMLSRVFVELR